MRFKLNGPIGEGREVEFDESQMKVKEARLLKKVTGLGLRQFGEGMRDGDIDALMGMVYIALRREGVLIQWRALDDFNIGDLEVIAENEEQERALAEAGAGVVPGQVVAAGPDEFGPGDYGADEPEAAANGTANGAAVTELRPTPPAEKDEKGGKAPGRRRAAAGTR